MGFASIFLLLALAFAVVALLLAGALKSGMLSLGSTGTSGTAAAADDAAAAGGCLLQAACCPIGPIGWGWWRRRRGAAGEATEEDEERGRREPLLPPPPPPPPSPVIIKAVVVSYDKDKAESAGLSPPPIGLGRMLALPGVLAASLVVLLSFNSIGWMELSLSGHAKASLRLPPWAVGLLFSLVDSAYAVTGYCLPRIRSAAGGCRPLALAGLLCQALAFAVLGPVPTPWSHSGGSSGGQGVADGVLAWSSVVLGVR